MNEGAEFFRLCGVKSTGNGRRANHRRYNCKSAGISDFNFILAQNHMPAALWCQLKIALAARACFTSRPPVFTKRGCKLVSDQFPILLGDASRRQRFPKL
jgi:hypothetical protein